MPKREEGGDENEEERRRAESRENGQPECCGPLKEAKDRGVDFYDASPEEEDETIAK